jgi:hypothetical protein
MRLYALILIAILVFANMAVWGALYLLREQGGWQ